MIYITGDTHADFKGRFSTQNFPQQKEMTKDDYLIICGDFGGVWDAGGESKTEKWWLDWFEERNYTLLFVDGNHENYGSKIFEILFATKSRFFDIGNPKAEALLIAAKQAFDEDNLNQSSDDTEDLNNVNTIIIFRSSDKDDF